ncbi:MAG: hypothetical protein HOV81_44900 [Kofleriaceae bacterium]|nr:hypothetical protein [Kofleriaceae bacterium]
MADDPNQLASIDPAMLAAVTGGASSGSSEQVTTMLQSLMSSIKDLAASRKQSSGFDFMQMMPMMNRGQGAPVEAAQPPMPPDGDPNGWSRVA